MKLPSSDCSHCEQLRRELNEARNQLTAMEKESKLLEEKLDKAEQLVDALSLDVAMLKGEVNGNGC